MPSPGRGQTDPQILFTRAGWRELGGHLLFALVVFGLSALLAWKVVPGVLHGGLVEPDNYMRLLRVERLAETRSWYDNSIPRSNYPYGEILHWTRPVDVALVLLALPLLAFFSFTQALHIAGVLFSPLLLVLLCFAVAWGITPLAGKRVRYFAMIAVLAQPGIVSYALPGRPDHHPVLLLTFALCLGFLIRWFLDPSHRRWALAAGAAGGFGVWLGTEFLFPIAIVLATGFLLWVWEGREFSRTNLSFSLGLLGTLALALVVEHPPSDLFAVEYDRLSAPHVLVGLLVFAFWLLMALAADHSNFLPGRGGRALWGVVFGGLAVGALTVAYPDFLRGPEAGIDPQLWPIWRDYIQETRPLLSDLGPGSLGLGMAYLGPVLFCLPFLLVALARDWRSPRGGAWLLLTACLAVYVPVALRLGRFVAYPEVILAMVTAVLIAILLPRLDRVPGFRRILLRAITTTAVITGCIWIGAVLMGVGGQGGSQVRAADSAAGMSCPVSITAEFLADPNALGDRPRTVLAHLDYGPEILYRTQHRVIGTPFQRNSAGIIDSFRIFSAIEPEDARELVAARGIDLILVCPQHAWLYGGRRSSPESPTLFDRLTGQAPPSWLAPVPAPRETVGDFLLYQVLRTSARPGT